MSVEAIREAISDRLDTIDGLAAFAYVPDSINAMPCAYPFPSGTDYDVTMAAGAHWQTWTVEVVVNIASGKAAQIQLDGFIEPSGPLSVKEAIEQYDEPGRVTLGGACNDLHVTACTGYTPYVLHTAVSAGGGAQALGCQWTVEILVSG